MNISPAILFVCQSNAGKSQMAEAIARATAPEGFEFHSAGTKPGSGINEESAASVAEIGADMLAATPKGIDPELLRAADRVIILGSKAELDMPEDAKGTLERWEIDEPSERGIEGTARMNLIRDDIASHIRELLTDFA